MAEIASHEGGVHYQSKIEDYQGVVKKPSSLPVDLSSFRFLGGGKNEQDYLLFSELFELSDDTSKNIIKVRVGTPDPLLRVYVEDNSITTKFKCFDSSG